jgi:hypothetical protein
LKEQKTTSTSSISSGKNYEALEKLFKKEGIISDRQLEYNKPLRSIKGCKIRVNRQLRH